MLDLTIEKVAIIFGALFLFLISPYISSILPFFPHIHIPSSVGKIVFSGNVLILLMPLLLGDGALFFIPGCFIILSLFFKKKNYIHFFTSLVSIIMILDIVWIMMSWQVGIRYQKLNFVITIILENAVFFFIIYSLILMYYKYKHVVFLYFAALLFCLTLMFFAFPWLGEPI